MIVGDFFRGLVSGNPWENHLCFRRFSEIFHGKNIQQWWIFMDFHGFSPFPLPLGEFLLGELGPCQLLATCLRVMG